MEHKPFRSSYCTETHADTQHNRPIIFTRSLT